MILTEDYLARLASGADIINESVHETRYFSSSGNASVFLSHKHDDLANLKRVVYILEKLHSNVYVDWLDKTMPKITSGETAVKIKDKIRKMDKFILVASDAAIESKWCNWELGFGDAQKYDRGKIALFPICKVWFRTVNMETFACYFCKVFGFHCKWSFIQIFNIKIL